MRFFYMIDKCSLQQFRAEWCCYLGIGTNVLASWVRVVSSIPVQVGVFFGGGGGGWGERKINQGLISWSI